GLDMADRLSRDGRQADRGRGVREMLEVGRSHPLGLEALAAASEAAALAHVAESSTESSTAELRRRRIDRQGRSHLEAMWLEDGPAGPRPRDGAATLTPT